MSVRRPQHPSQLPALPGRNPVRDALNRALGSVRASMFFRPTSGSGSSVTIIDDFEDQDLSEYGGDTANTSIVTSPVSNGSYAIQLQNSNNHVSISSTTGLNAYPQQGETFKCDVYRQDAVPYTNFHWATQSETSLPDSYLAQLDGVNNQFKLRIRQGGSESGIASTALTPTKDVWRTFEVEWLSDGSMTLRLLDSSGTELAKVSGTDTTYSSGGIAFNMEPLSDTHTALFDYVRK